VSSAGHGNRGYRGRGTRAGGYRGRGRTGRAARATAYAGLRAYRECMNVLLGHLRGAVRRHPHLADAAIALAVLAATAATTLTGHQPTAADRRASAIVAAVLACGALTGRRRWPLASLGISALAAEVFLLVTPDANGVLILLAPSIALYTVAEQAERRRGLMAGGGALAALALLHAVLHPGMIGPENLAFTALGGLAIAAGDSSRNRRAYLAEVELRAERSELERDLVARRRVEQERLRIARDLHDSVGHHLALISVQSDVAGRAVDGDAAAAREALLHVKSASRKALEELRDTVSLLRQPGDPVAPTAVPAPGLDALEELIGSLRASGLAIDTLVHGAAVPLAPAADVTAYRVIQEALTNVCKHSSRRQVQLALGYDRGELRITVDDLGADDRPGSGSALPAAPRPTGGQGIRGMRERLLALGGRLAAGPRPGGGFRVDAFLPYQPLGVTSGDGAPRPGAVGEPDRPALEPLP
jgi:signal transduction histidine kinase